MLLHPVRVPFHFHSHVRLPGVVFSQKQAQYKIDISFKQDGHKYLPYVIGKFAFGMLELSESLLKEKCCIDS
jgi:hypothetical protein